MTPRLHLTDTRDGSPHRFAHGPVRIGRAGSSEVVVRGRGADVVSGAHARFELRAGGWWLEDAGARNGTFLDGRRVARGQPVAVRTGQVVRLGEHGPSFTIRIDIAVEPDKASEAPSVKVEEETMPLAPVGAGRRARPAAAELSVVLIHAASGKRLEAIGGRLRVGRGRECELRLPPEERGASRVHCELVRRPDGTPVVRDAHSRNGTFLNGERVAGERPVVAGDRLELGPGGTKLQVDQVRTGVEALAAGLPPRRSFGGKGRTLFVRELLRETERTHASRVRAVIWTFVVLLAAVVGGVYWYAERQARETQAALADQRQAVTAARAAADSARAAAAAEYQRLATELARARGLSAPAAVVDSLRTALADARARTATLEVALVRAREAVAQQLSAGDSLRATLRAETERLRAELARRSSGAAATAGLLDSLHQAVRAAEQQVARLEAGLRAVRSADLAGIAQDNQGAVGLVSAFVGPTVYDGSGFVITPSGYFVTARHVVRPDGRLADSVHVTMADQRTGYRAAVVAAAPADGPDLAVLQLPKYVGPYTARVDWAGTRVRQGEPAALIGFPAGVAAALDNTRTVRTSMSAGIFSKVTPTVIQFDGFTVGGSSGSPIFNAAGDVVAVHAAGLREAAGLGFAVPAPLIVPLLPAGVRTELER